ncbi:CocE/NonD family hydrolase, partial [Salinactinospora qingdaonensis]|uniref:CocE/NonD family hydrolase n=1 Tax=Salinactinospora qingdaonensis TaxID=702744 RepID=UPI003CD0661E
GFYDSDGGVEVAGPKDVADARAVIDWALESTAADPAAIGMAGLSRSASINPSSKQDSIFMNRAGFTMYS